MTILISSGATPVVRRFSNSFSCVSKIFFLFSSSLLPIPVSIRMFCLPVRTSTELQLTVMRLSSSAGTFFCHMTLGMMPKNAPPSATYVPSEIAVSSKSPSVMVWLFKSYLLRPQEFTVKVRPYARKQMDARPRPGDAMRLARIKLQIKLLACINEGIDHLHAVLHVNIVVTGAVDLQQMAF